MLETRSGKRDDILRLRCTSAALYGRNRFLFISTGAYGVHASCADELLVVTRFLCVLSMCFALVQVEWSSRVQILGYLVWYIQCEAMVFPLSLSFQCYGIIWLNEIILAKPSFFFKQLAHLHLRHSSSCFCDCAFGFRNVSSFESLSKLEWRIFHLHV